MLCGVEKGDMRKYIIKVPYIDQTKEWPTGCESVSAVMFLQYLGMDVSVKEFVERYLEKVPLVEREGKLYGGDPREVFVGDPADDKSMGCYAPVIKRALEKVFGEKKAGLLPCGPADAPGAEGYGESGGSVWEPVDLTAAPMEVLLREYIDRDIPVIFWASIDLKETYAGPEWTIPDTGQIFTWRSNEHCMLLVGYDEENYYFNDPWHGHGTIAYDRTLVEKRHREQYEMAVSVKRRTGGRKTPK